jgi:hypothetical protein
MDVKTPMLSAPHDTAPTGDSWRTRPDRTGYAMRKEYCWALACVADVVGSFFLVMLIVTA